MAFIRTILGDVPVDPAGPGLGACDAHEHLALRGDFIAESYPDFLLDDPEKIAADLAEFRSLGGGWVVDTMPTGPGRDAAMLGEVSRQSGVAVVCATGLHLAMYYPPDHPMLAMDAEALARLFIDEITVGLRRDAGEQRVPGRAGVIKVAGGLDRLDGLQSEAFAAAGRASAATGCPIITHCEDGTAGMQQIERLTRYGASADRIVLSHCDRRPDAGYHRAMLETGAALEYDNHFRDLKRGDRCPSAELIAELAPDFPDQIVLGMDLARRSYWPSYGGGPGPAWLLRELPAILQNHGIDPGMTTRLLTLNPLRSFSFRP